MITNAPTRSHHSSGLGTHGLDHVLSGQSPATAPERGPFGYIANRSGHAIGLTSILSGLPDQEIGHISSNSRKLSFLRKLHPGVSNWRSSSIQTMTYSSWRLST
jgi:hypothetical protein